MTGSSVPKRRFRMPRNGISRKLHDDDSREAQLYSQNQITSPLLALPFEVRRMIYTYLLGEKCIFIQYKPHEYKKRSKSGVARWEHTVDGGFVCTVYPRHINPFLEPHSSHRELPRSESEKGMTLMSGVCRQLYYETATLSFEENIWAFATMQVMHRFLVKENKLALRQRKAMRTLFLRDKNLGGLMAKMLTKLELVLVDLDRHLYRFDMKNMKTSCKEKSKDEVRLSVNHRNARPTLPRMEIGHGS